MLEKPLFPTMFYETQIPKDLSFAILDEIKHKQQTIELVSEATQIIPVSDYATDFAHSIRMLPPALEFDIVPDHRIRCDSALY